MSVADVPEAALEVVRERGEEEEESPAGPKHRRLEPLSSVTARALMALGAIAAAIGLGSTAQAFGTGMYGKQRASITPDVAAPEPEGTPETSRPVAEGAQQPVQSASVPAKAKAVRVVGVTGTKALAVVPYVPPQGSGKHRKPIVSAGGQHPDSKLSGGGKHRRGHGDTCHHDPVGGGVLLAAGHSYSF